MKMSHIAAAAGLFVASLGVATSADAQPYRGDRHHQVDRDRGDRYEGNRHRGDRWNHDRRGRGYAYGHNNHRRCWTEWRHHRRIRVCR
jgi:hypothetical protein